MARGLSLGHGVRGPVAWVMPAIAPYMFVCEGSAAMLAAFTPRSSSPLRMAPSPALSLRHSVDIHVPGSARLKDELPIDERVYRLPKQVVRSQSRGVTWKSKCSWGAGGHIEWIVRRRTGSLKVSPALSLNVWNSLSYTSNAPRKFLMGCCIGCSTRIKSLSFDTSLLGSHSQLSSKHPRLALRRIPDNRQGFVVAQCHEGDLHMRG